ncbi:hypothetical protein GEV33_011628 [Tenebrio molitor]|uniref:Uncharacterized protein n=1 Tax=Tenebrio molitor TaxID=7067 RepID=A0A8J6L9N5_TENMO|nr:hypothetical protein GEV33_011628 [Tenebrio molitor]
MEKLQRSRDALISVRKIIRQSGRFKGKRKRRVARDPHGASCGEFSFRVEDRRDMFYQGNAQAERQEHNSVTGPKRRGSSVRVRVVHWEPTRDDDDDVARSSSHNIFAEEQLIGTVLSAGGTRSVNVKEAAVTTGKRGREPAERSGFIELRTTDGTRVRP